MSRLQPPPANRFVNPDEVIPLSPPMRPPFAHYASSTIPATPHTPYTPAPPGQPQPREGDNETRLRPYLSLSPRILLTFFSPCLLPMILTIAHLLQNRSSTSSLAASLKASMMSACSGLAKGAASVQAIPRYLAMQTNQEAIRATQASIRAVGTMLMDAVKIIEVVVNFIVDTYRSMLLCTIELAVRGTLEIMIAAVAAISDAVTSSLNSIRTEIQSDISSANNVIQSAVSAINSVTSLVNVNLSVPTFSIPSLSFLANVTIPTTFEDSLVTLNSSLPTLAELKDKMNEIIDVPFEALIAQINATRLEMAASFNDSILPVPSLTTLSANSANDLNNELCTDLDTSLIDDTANALHKLSNVAIGLMFLLLFLVWAALAVWEWRKWRVMKNTVEAVEDEWRREGRADAWRMVAIVEHPVLEKYSSQILERLAPRARTRTNMRWFLSYLAHPTCLALLFISLLGFLSIQFQLVALNAIKAHAESNANATVSASANSLAAKLNAAAMSSSQEYADSYNAAIAGYQQRIDDELFGSWLNTTAVTLNTTLVEFYDEVEKVLNTTFSGTILFNPINTFMYCILGSKITNLEKGLTWISEHAHIDLPTLPADILLLSNSSMDEIATPIAAAAVGSGDDDDDSGVVGTLIEHFENALKVERTFYAVMLGVWLALFFMGLAIVLWNSGGRERYTAWRGVQTPPPGFGGGPASSAAQAKWRPWVGGSHPIYDTYAEKQFRGTTPTPGAGGVQTYGDVPHIAEPRDEKSYLHVRETAGRTGLMSGIASLAAPGQSFLKLAGWKLTGTPATERGASPFDDDARLVRPGTSSEKYSQPQPYPYPYPQPQPQQAPVSRDHSNSPFPRPSSSNSSRPETPQPFWVDKFYGAFEGVKSLFPTRGQRHGAQLGRNASQRTEKSFGASQVPTARTPGDDWAGGVDARDVEGRRAEPEWTMVDPQSIGRALDPMRTSPGGRYPQVAPPAEHTRNLSHAQHSTHLHPSYTAEPTYPRPMSRAPTLGEGAILPRSSAFNPFNDQLPPLPSKDKPDSIDYLAEYDSADSPTPSRSETDREGSRWGVTSPASSSMSYWAAEPQVSSANRVHLGGGASASVERLGEGAEGKGVGQATAALAGIMKELQERKERDDPFGDGRRI
ncbi:hypothetical protein IAT38_003465 [Cryptococcus sp. DSM 104549]